jgi:hypothetical protein
MRSNMLTAPAHLISTIFLQIRRFVELVLLYNNTANMEIIHEIVFMAVIFTLVLGFRIISAQQFVELSDLCQSF